ncbi:hypothetical protein EGW08_013151 [Elysia chlorotica]|uniref:MYND-type domain-containing protein n=1 Tax=Elysia chlorotica TaxID=188477 RepID=A0A3S0ZZP8_ELYCH|nr:hypothetical protein EGW08_013151 [Elysia chlorotica]
MMKGSVKKIVKKEVLMHKETVNSHLRFHFDSSLDLDLESNQSASAPRSKSEKQTMPTDFVKPPFALPEHVEDHQRINRILRYSLRQQKEDEISDNAAIVTFLISRCLTAASIPHRVVCGYRRVYPDDCSNNNPMPFPVSPHVWLVIKDHIIDNTYIKIMPEWMCNYLHDHISDCYDETDNEFNGASKLQDEVPSICIPRGFMKKKIQFCLRRPDMALALGHNNEHFYNFFFSMIRHIYETYGATVKGIDPTTRLICWRCESYPETGKGLYSDALAHSGQDCLDVELKSVPSSSSTTWRFLQCSRCMVANYCSVECQSQDWWEIHEYLCLSRGSVFLPPISNSH